MVIREDYDGTGDFVRAAEELVECSYCGNTYLRAWELEECRGCGARFAACVFCELPLCQGERDAHYGCWATETSWRETFGG